MSYREYFSETISVSASESYSYPPSEEGGSGTVTVYIDVPVNVEILVNTDPFDKSVSRAEDHISVLTETVVASETAEVLAINESSRKISGSIVNGFFSYIRYDISQQISEYRPIVDTKLMQLVKLREACIAKKTQMGDDFARIAERYTNIFNDLDKEVSNRVRSLNQAAFSAGLQISAQVNCSSDHNLFNTATVSNLENSNAFSLLFASSLKYRTFQLIKKARKLLLSDRNLKIMLKSILVPQDAKKNALKYLPLVFAETNNEKGAVRPSITFDTNFNGFQSANFKSKTEQTLRADAFAWQTLSENARYQVETYLQTELAKANAGSDIHKNRVSETIWQLWNNNKTAIKSN